jgi:hypothetical protein
VPDRDDQLTLARSLDALAVRIIDGTASSWWDGYGHARAYHEQHGNLVCAENCIRAGEVPDVRQSQVRASVALDRMGTAAAGRSSRHDVRLCCCDWPT